MDCAEFAPLSADAQNSTEGVRSWLGACEQPLHAESPLSCSVLSSADTGGGGWGAHGKKKKLFLCKHS